MLKLISSLAILGILCLCNVAGADAGAALTVWKDPGYTQRFFIKVEAPGLAGSVALMPEPSFATIFLPLKVIKLENGELRSEPVLLIGEDGAVCPVFTRPVAGGVEIIFSTRASYRLFCLYAGGAEGATKKASPAMAEPQLPRVKMRGFSATSLTYSEQTPLTLDRFKKALEGGETPLSGFPRPLPNSINSPECPYFKIDITQFGHITDIKNPKRYAALYEAFLRTPVEGEYKFALDTPGAAFVLIDGQPVVSAAEPDPARGPFALQGSAQLTEGVHRVTVYYAEASSEPSKIEARSIATNVELSRFGLRLHWRPPFASALVCVPPQAFCKFLPAVVTRAEAGEGVAASFIHIENMGQIRVAAHRADPEPQERVMLFAESLGIENAVLRVSAPGMSEVVSKPGAVLGTWVPAGVEVSLSVLGADQKPVVTRTVLLPRYSKTSTADVLNLEGELLVKSAPDFIYPDETAHIHLETLLSPAPALVNKERLESKMLPPAPRPMGEFNLRWELRGANGLLCPAQDIALTPIETARRKSLIPLSSNAIVSHTQNSLEAHLQGGPVRLAISLSVGGSEIETSRFSLLHSAQPWPGVLTAGPGTLLFKSATSPAEEKPDRLIIVIPQEDEASYRGYAVLRKNQNSSTDTRALFLGDPLVEQIDEQTPSAKLPGVAAALARAIPNLTWSAVSVAGPHRNLPVFRLLAEFEEYAAANAGKAPPLVVVCLGGGDVARQTPLHTFERAIDALIDRLRLAGARKIIFAGVIPEPSRERQCAPYQDRVLDVLRRHHIDGVNIYDEWKRQSDWTRHFLMGSSEGSPVYAPVPNAEALEEIGKLIKDRL